MCCHPMKWLGLLMWICIQKTIQPAQVRSLRLLVGSAFEDEYGYYVDAASPDLPTLPDGWEDRFVVHDFGDVRALFLELNDAAISKYARGEMRDRIWIQEGLKAKLLSMPTIEYRLRKMLSWMSLKKSLSNNGLLKIANSLIWNVNFII